MFQIEHQILSQSREDIINYIQVYAPCNNAYTEEQREEFFNVLAGVLDKILDSEYLIIIGYANGKVSRRRTPWEAFLGSHNNSRAECNYNGEQLLTLCAEYKIFMTKTFFSITKVRSTNSTNGMIQQYHPKLITIWQDHLRGKMSLTQSNDAVPMDHRPVILTLRPAKQKSSSQKTKSAVQFNLRKLQK